MHSEVLPSSIPEADPAEEYRGREVEEARGIVKEVRTIGREFRGHAETSEGCFARRWACGPVVLVVLRRLLTRRVWRSGRCLRGV